MKLYWRIKKNGKWTWMPAKLAGYQHPGYAQVEALVEEFVYKREV